MNLRPGDITGVVLAGGQGRRMGGVDKGLQLLNGTPLAQLALQRLAPQVGPLAVNANRHAEAYAAFGVPVWADDLPAGVPSHPGPLAGWLAALERCSTPWLVTVPCDTPAFPADLVARLAAALATSDAPIALAATRHGTGLRAQPVFCLLPTTLAPQLRQSLLAGQRRVEAWALQQHPVLVPFEDSAAFFNANTAQDLQALQR